MIGLGFIFRVIQFIIFFAIACGLLYAVVWVVNQGVQLTADALGFEVGDFFEWLRTKLPKRKKRRAKK